MPIKIINVGTASESAEQSLRDAFAQLPEQVQELYASRNQELIIGKFLSHTHEGFRDKDAGHTTIEKAGDGSAIQENVTKYDGHAGWNASETNQQFFAENYVRDFVSYKNNNIGGALFHESGHIVDQELGKLSNSSESKYFTDSLEYKAAFQADIDALRANDFQQLKDALKEVDYSKQRPGMTPEILETHFKNIFVNAETAGREAYAEAFANAYGGNSSMPGLSIADILPNTAEITKTHRVMIAEHGFTKEVLTAKSEVKNKHIEAEKAPEPVMTSVEAPSSEPHYHTSKNGSAVAHAAEEGVLSQAGKHSGAIAARAAEEGVLSQLGKHSGALGGVVFGAVAAGAALVTGSSVSQAAEEGVKMAIPGGEAGLEAAKGNYRESAISGSVEFISTAAATGAGAAVAVATGTVLLPAAAAVGTGIVVGMAADKMFSEQPLTKTERQEMAALYADAGKAKGEISPKVAEIAKLNKEMAEAVAHPLSRPVTQASRLNALNEKMETMYKELRDTGELTNVQNELHGQAAIAKVEPKKEPITVNPLAAALQNSGHLDSIKTALAGVKSDGRDYAPGGELAASAHGIQQSQSAGRTA